MALESSKHFASLIIGDGSLPIRCAEILLSRGHEIRAIVSTDSDVTAWARKNKIVDLAPGPDLAEQIKGPIDYLFSIVNQNILKDDVLCLPKKLAINYHDAPLPRYAGTHATSWALMNHETSYAVSWHVITDVVDAGDILKQRSVDISVDDTALTLNTKCFESAVASFEELVDGLASGTVIPQKQDLEQRTFFPRYKRPANGGVITWDKNADDISAMVRALDFGSHPNPLGAPKVLIDNKFFLVDELIVQDSPSLNGPGTIIDIGLDSVSISANDKAVVLRSLREVNGKSITIADLTSDLGLRSGYKLNELDPGHLSRVADLNQEICKSEPYWLNKLAKFEATQPPYLVGGSVSENKHRSSEPVPISPEISTFFSSHGVIAAFGSFLMRLNGSDSLHIGVSTESLLKKTEGIDGLFATELPLLLDFDHSQTFSEFLKQFEKELRSIEKHGTYLRDIVTRYKQLSHVGDLVAPVGVAMVAHVDEYQPADGQIVTLVLSNDGQVARLLYDSEKIQKQNIDRLIGNFATFLRGIVADQDCEIALLPLLTESERNELLFDWNPSTATVHNGELIHELFEKQVRQTPNSTALIFGSDSLTYEELNQKANRLARHLQKLGVGSEVLTAICIERSINMVVGILAILKAGGAYIPLDPAYPLERLEYMLADSGAPFLLTREELGLKLGDYKGTVIGIDSQASLIELECGENLKSEAKPNNLAYVIYTSGSTGKPKGVAIEHHSTVSLINWATSVFTSDDLEGVLASTSMCFDLSLFEMFVPLSSGGKVILVENILHLSEAPSAAEVTLINTVPSAITELIKIGGVPSTVKTVNLAGEPLKSSLVEQIYELGSVQKVYDLYGPSEDTTYSTFTLRDTGPAHIGRPISGTQAYILDRRLQPLPVGIAGELYLGGDGLARGYLNKPELTAERFVNYPFDTGLQKKLYKTGDLVRYFDNGNIEYLGRIDNQVKIRGFRIELGEIESILSTHAAVSNNAVIVREDRPGDKRIVAYFTRNISVGVDELRDHLKQKLPDYMIPAAFVELDELPLTPNGKIDRKALPVPMVTAREQTDSFVSHRDETEHRLTKIWEEILDVSPIGIHDDFFELGGHSLQAIRMFARVEEEFCKSIPLATLFEAGTIEKLASILRQEDLSERESCLVPIQPNGTKPIFFCIHAKGGNVLFYRDLAKHLGGDQPFYGIQARRLGGRQIGHGTVEEMAEFYINEMKTLQPEGPYYLGGSSFGGLAAFEIAQQLHRTGDNVGLLALLDTGTPDYPKMLETSLLKAKVFSVIERIEHHRDSLKGFENNSARKAYVVAKLNKVKLKYRRKFNNRYKKFVRSAYVKVKGEGSIPSSYIQLEDQIWRAGQNYVPKPYPGKMTLFRAKTQPLGIVEDPTLGWNGLSSELEIHDVPGHHGSIVNEPFVGILAEKLAECMESASLCQVHEVNEDAEAISPKETKTLAAPQYS